MAFKNIGEELSEWEIIVENDLQALKNNEEIPEEINKAIVRKLEEFSRENGMPWREFKVEDRSSKYVLRVKYAVKDAKRGGFKGVHTTKREFEK